MKLLTPQANKSNKEAETLKKILWIKEMEEVIKRVNMQLANAEADFNKMLAGQRMRWANEEGEHNIRKSEMANEIKKLEIKKANALIPLGIINASGEDRLAEAEKFITDLHTREERVEELTEFLEDKLDDVGEREQTVKQRESKLSFEIEGMESQKKSVLEGTAQLSKELGNFAERVSRTDKDIDERKTALVLLDRTLISREESLNNKEKELNIWATRLHDERGTLDRAWKELNRLKEKYDKTRQGNSI